MKPKTLIYSLVVTSMVANLADAAVLRYRQSGNWNAITNGSTPGWGPNPNGVGSAIPGAGDEARINFGNNTVTINSAVPDTAQVKIGVDEGGTLIIANGGSLKTTGLLRAGNNDGGAISDTTGTLTVQNGGSLDIGGIFWSAHNNSSGIINVDAGGNIIARDHLWWGTSLNAQVNISGTITQTGGILGLGTLNAVSPSGGTAVVNILDGGLLALNNLSGASGSPSIQAGSVINMEAGSTFTVNGDGQIGNVQRYIDAGKIVAVGGTFDLTNGGGLTTLTVQGATVVIPEPSVVGLAAIGAMLGLFSRRRK
ncbi:MAG: hypothetical protein AB8D78_13050 [Akkermansiaceae bacterium]